MFVCMHCSFFVVCFGLRFSIFLDLSSLHFSHSLSMCRAVRHAHIHANTYTHARTHTPVFLRFPARVLTVRPSDCLFVSFCICVTPHSFLWLRMKTAAFIVR